jgi:hypothetical protein
MRLQPRTAVKERRLLLLLKERGLSAADPGLLSVVEDAQLLGSLELAGFPFSWDDVRAARLSGAGPADILALRRAQAAVDPRAPLSLAALRAWHAALAGPVGYRGTAREREGARPSPPRLIESRVAALAEWLSGESAGSLKPEQAAALALARLVEILPFDDANGRVSRLAASHLMVRGGLRPPILVRGDRPRLESCLRAAFRLETESLVTLLVEASERALDVMIQHLERGGASTPSSGRTS